MVNGNVEQETDIKKSLDRFIDLLIATPIGQFKSDPDFGFVFKNFRFVNFYEKKSGIETSKNPSPENFAFALKSNIERYEPRLSFCEVEMDYDVKKRNVKLVISGLIKGDKVEKYSREFNFHV